MYIHLGSDVSVRSREIIGMFDMESTSVAKDTKSFLANCENTDCVTTVSPDLPKSYVLCSGEGRPYVFVTGVGTPTLRKRASRSGVTQFGD